MSSLQFIRELVSRGADVNARLLHGPSGRGKLNETGATAFLFASHTADVPLMRLLVELGADPKIPNADNCPALLAAAGIGVMAPGEEPGTDEEVVAAMKYILQLGADINAASVIAGLKSLEPCGLCAYFTPKAAEVSAWRQR